MSWHKCTTICVDINTEGNKRTVQDVVKSGGKSREYTCDVTNSKAVADLSKMAGPVVVFVPTPASCIAVFC